MHDQQGLARVAAHAAQQQAAAQRAGLQRQLPGGGIQALVFELEVDRGGQAPVMRPVEVLVVARAKQAGPEHQGVGEQMVQAAMLGDHVVRAVVAEQREPVPPNAHHDDGHQARSQAPGPCARPQGEQETREGKQDHPPIKSGCAQPSQGRAARQRPDCFIGHPCHRSAFGHFH